jgi:hypothetical protein
MVACYNVVPLSKTLCSTWNLRIRRVYTSMRGSVKTKWNEKSWVEDAPCWLCWCRSRNTDIKQLLTSAASASLHDFLHEDHTKSTGQDYLVLLQDVLSQTTTDAKNFFLPIQVKSWHPKFCYIISQKWRLLTLSDLIWCTLLRMLLNVLNSEIEKWKCIAWRWKEVQLGILKSNYFCCKRV